MNRTDALRRIKALREVRVDRGATTHEAKTAQAIRERLETKFSITGAESAPSPASPRPRPTQRPFASGARVNFAEFLRRTQEEIDWWFNPSTGQGSENVTVVSYRDPANWKIEIDQRR